MTPKHLVCGLLFLLGSASVFSHPACFSSGAARLEKDGVIRVSLRFDLLAFALNDTSARIGNAPMEALLSGPRAILEERLAEARERLMNGVEISTDRGRGTWSSIRFPDADEVYASVKSGGPMLPLVMDAELTGKIPGDATWMRFRFPEVLDQLALTVEIPGKEDVGEFLEPGACSSDLRLSVATGGIPPGSGHDRERQAASWSMIGDFVGHGVMHILRGYDHLLFLSALVIATASFWEMAWVIAAFTAAHSLTLALCAFGIFRLPSWVVEPVISLSIVFVGLENAIWPQRARSWMRLAVAFGFGLVHGLGFAGGLLDAMRGLPNVGIWMALLAFSLGVEIGNQLVALPCYGVVTLVHKRCSAKARMLLIRIGSLIIALLGAHYFYIAIKGCFPA